MAHPLVRGVCQVQRQRNHLGIARDVPDQPAAAGLRHRLHRVDRVVREQQQAMFTEKINSLAFRDWQPGRYPGADPLHDRTGQRPRVH